MIVPAYWAEGRVQSRAAGRQVTVRRFGWSDESLAAAQTHADTRAQEALARILAGEHLDRREPKMPYNGAQGLPIREEIVARHGAAIVTRNAYGARCLNTENVFFADIDFAPLPFAGVGPLVTLGAFALAVIAWSLGLRIWIAITLPTLLLFVVGMVRSHIQRRREAADPPERRAHRAIDAFLSRHPDWHLRIYGTPAGLRLLAMQATFDATDPAVERAFRELGVDRVYARMCLNQRCFRARVSPKPWRLGLDEHLRPRPGVWPVNPARLPERQRWIEDYERKARDYAACRFLVAKGSSHVVPEAEAVRRLHDELCGAEGTLPLA